MTQQWFLDLDGTKSGPYDSNEILSLLASGEVMPHHRISSQLKDPNWISILEWRLQQAKLMPASGAPPPPRPKPIYPEDDVTRTEIVKRDPMAEMFDMLQNTKQKREAKSIEAAQQQKAVENKNSLGAKKELNQGLMKTIGVGIAITVFGFFLGQLFQKSSVPPAPAITATTPSPTPSPALIAAETPQDRSTDKITIKSKPIEHPAAERRSEPLQAALPTHTQPQAPQNDNAPSDKEIKELVDLKKELQELKNLKDELKNSLNDEDFQNDGEAVIPDEGPNDYGTPQKNPNQNTHY